MAELDRFTELTKSAAVTIPQSDFGNDCWRLESPAVLRLLDKLRRAGKPLGDYCDGKFIWGVRTGLNEAFVVDQTTRDRLIADHPSSAELLKPYARGRDVKRWKITWPGLYVIAFPHGFHAQLERYPAILKHLESFKKELKARAQCLSKRGGGEGGQHHWLELDNNPKPEFFKNLAGSKIVYPDIYEHQSFTWDDTGLFVANTCYFIPTNQKWLIGLSQFTSR